MKYLFCILMFTIVSVSFAEEDYAITIDGKPFEMSLGKEKKITLKDGQSVSVIITKKDIVSFDGRLYSFQHKSSFLPNRIDLGTGTFQTTLTTASGSQIIVQEWNKAIPDSFVNTMIKRLTEEELASGYKMKERDIEKDINGTIFRGKEAITTSVNEEWTRCVFLANVGKQRLLIVTMIEKDNIQKDSDVIITFWKSLRLKS